MNYTEVKQLFPSRMRKLEKPGTETVRSAGIPGRCLRILLVTGILGILALAYYYLGDRLQAADPAVAWMDVGALSLPLFAAWSCMLGVGIAGLLPAVGSIIGRKGGMDKWKANGKQWWSVCIFTGYIVLLYALL